MGVLLASFQNFLGSYFFQNTHGWVHLIIQISFCLEHQWTPLNGCVGDCGEMSNCREEVVLME